MPTPPCRTRTRGWVGGWWMVWVVETGLVGDYSVTWQGQKREYTQLFIMIYGMFLGEARVWG